MVLILIFPKQVVRNEIAVDETKLKLLKSISSFIFNVYSIKTFLKFSRDYIKKIYYFLLSKGSVVDSSFEVIF